MLTRQTLETAIAELHKSNRQIQETMQKPIPAYIKRDLQAQIESFTTAIAEIEEELAKPEGWRETIGCFDDNPAYGEISEAGRRIRKEESESLDTLKANGV